jgi:hypothetical protein
MATLPSPDNTSNPEAFGYEANLDNLLLRMAAGPGRQLSINTAPLQAQAVNTSETPEDFQQEFGQIYSRTDFSGGEGLDKAHKRNGTDRDYSRYWDSKGIDVFGGDNDQSYNLQLLHDTESKSVTLTDTNNYMTQTTNGNLYLADGTTLYQSTDGGETWSAMTTTPVTISYDITGLAAFGNSVYITTSNGTNGQFLHYDPAAGTPWHSHNTGFTNNNFQGVWFAKGSLFIAGKSSTAEYFWNGDPFADSFASSFTTGTALFKVEPTHEITSVIDAGAVVLAGSTDGNIYSLKIDAGTWSLKGQTKIPFEEIHSLAATEGLVFIGTKGFQSYTGRFYTSELTVADNLYVLTNRQLIKQWDNGVDQSPHSMFVTRDSVYMGIHESATETNLWRYYLPTGGIARDLSVTGHTSSATAKMLGITQTGTSTPQFVFVVSGVGVYKELLTYVDDGYLITALADFYTSEKKQWVGAKLSTESIQSGAVKLFTSTFTKDLDDADANTWEEQVHLTSGVGGDEQVMELVNGRWITAKLTISTVDTSQTPKLLSFAIRGFQLVEDLIVEMPVNVSDQIERPYRKALNVKGQGELIYQALRNKEGKNVELEIYRPDTLLRGIIENVSAPVEEISLRGSATYYCLVRFRGSKVTTETTAGEGLGIALLGVGKLG